MHVVQFVFITLFDWILHLIMLSEIRSRKFYRSILSWRSDYTVNDDV